MPEIPAVDRIELTADSIELATETRLGALVSVADRVELVAL